MKQTRIAATVAAAVAFAFVGAAAHAQTQNPIDPPQPVDQNALQAVGGSPAPQTATGAPIGKTRDQVYRELLDSERNGEAKRIRGLYEGAK
ncbi:hypothetical protein [Paraburkholderia sp. EG304]|uniref:hypothetical protein n=1 Tax=Paraburkholderia sp. EG304 TaxID=3237015 RepID=UPI00397AFC6F